MAGGWFGFTIFFSSILCTYVLFQCYILKFAVTPDLLGKCYHYTYIYNVKQFEVNYKVYSKYKIKKSKAIKQLN